MSTLDEAWRWYHNTRRQLKLFQRLGEHYWEDLPWDGDLGREEAFYLIRGEQIVEETTFGLAHLDDLAVAFLFSVFEAQVRSHVLESIREESEQIRHRALRRAAEETMEQIAEGSFFQVLQPFKDAHADLVEQVNQVRRYRNWVAHGRGGVKPENVNPQMAYERLQRFLRILDGNP